MSKIEEDDNIEKNPKKKRASIDISKGDENSILNKGVVLKKRKSKKKIPEGENRSKTPTKKTKRKKSKEISKTPAKELDKLDPTVMKNINNEIAK